jgi:hypothetical protein
MDENGILLAAARRIIESKEVPQDISDDLKMAITLEHANLSLKNHEVLYGKNGIVQKVKFWEWASKVIIVVLLTEALALLLK